MADGIVLKTDKQGWEFEIRAGSRVILGRAPDSDICLSDPTVKRHHARLFQEDGQWHVEALNENGEVFVNGVFTTSSRIGAGDRLRIGAIELRVGSQQTR